MDFKYSKPELLKTVDRVINLITLGWRKQDFAGIIQQKSNGSKTISYCDLKDPRANCFCLEGAIARACGDAEQLRREVRELFKQALLNRKIVVGNVLLRDVIADENNFVASLAYFNDNICNDKSDVLNLCEDARRSLN